MAENEGLPSLDELKAENRRTKLLNYLAIVLSLVAIALSLYSMGVV